MNCSRQVKRILPSMKIKSSRVCVLLLAASLCPFGRAEILPADRRTVWNPGLNAVGGIPNRTTIYQTISPSGGDDTAAIQAALDNCPSNQVVLLGIGTFKITGGLNISKSNITLRGSGTDKTKLVQQTGEQFTTVISIGERSLNDQVALSADALKGTSSITLASAPPSGVPLAVGELVVIDHVTSALSWWNPDPTRSPGGGPAKDESRGWFCEYDRPIGQTMEIAAINGNTITFTTPLHTDFRVTDQSQLSRYWKGDKAQPITVPIQWSGIENLCVATLFTEGNGGGNFALGGVKYCWVKNVESDKSSGSGVSMDGSFRCELRDSYIHSTVWANPGGAGYGIAINFYASENLVENCISWSFNKVMVMRASGGGNVIGYNYMQDGWGSDYPNMSEVGLNASHYTTPHYELFEGNESFAFSGDSTWGNSVYITAFRNNLTTQRTAAPPLDTYTFSFVDGSSVRRTFWLEDGGNRNAIGVKPFHWYYNFIGNVLGSANMALLTNPKSDWTTVQTAFVENADGNDAHIPMWSLGQGEDAYIKDDPQVQGTALFHGNYDYVTKTIKWNSTNADHTLPASLYLAAKPTFFSTNTWPWVTPENAPNTTATLPAKVRFNTIIGAATTNYTAWRKLNFEGTTFTNNAISGPAADPDHTGVPNFLRYAFNLSARGPVGATIAAGTTGTGALHYLTLAFDRRTVGTDLSYVVEGSTNLVNWSPVTTYTPGSPTHVTAQDNVAFGAATKHFLRVRVVPVP